MPEQHCLNHRYCFRNRVDCETEPPKKVLYPVTDFCDRVDDPEKLKKRIFELEQVLAVIHEHSKI
jgi:hypothetical protein